MRIQKYFLSFALVFVSLQVLAADVSVDVVLVPAGSFKATTNKVKGTAYKTADGVIAENIIVDLKSLKTGVTLRDNHLKKELMADKYPEAKLISAKGKDGKGQAVIELRGMKQNVTGTYTIEGNILKAVFKMHLPDLKIKGIRYMGIGVKDDVDLMVNVPLTAAPVRKSASATKPVAKIKAKK